MASNYSYYDATTGAAISDDDLAAMHDDLIDDLYPVVTIGIYQWAASDVLKRMDPVAYRVSVIEYADQLIKDGRITDTPPVDPDGAVCTDCLMAIANADTSGIADIDAWSAGVDATDATDGGRYDVVPVGDETHFGTSSCDYCGTSLHGDRHDVVFIAR